MRALRDRELLDNTVIIVAGDHGEQLGEHGLYQHNNSLYLPALRVPLLVVAPGVQGPRAVDRVVSLRDIPATVMQLIGAADSPFRGVSLLRDVDPLGGDEVPAHSFLEQEWVEREDYPVARGRAMHALTTERWHFIRNGDGSVELYDWAADPGETRNLAGSSADSAAARLGETLDGLIRPR
jgi:arylsulfatase A-like enzyme